MRKHKHEHPSDETNAQQTEELAVAERQEPVGESAEAKDDVDLAAELARAKQENQELKDQLLRTMADLQNVRKRHAQEKHALQKLAAEDLIVALLPVLDNFERTLAAIESGASLESIVEGIRAVDRQLRATLEARHLVRIPAVGAAFDESVHEAVVTQPTEEVPAGTITDELEAGYMLGEKVIRPAKVRVAKAP
ncbi:MAG: nucleotide exchange factor GrpE [Fimbriimonadales bacterium]|nr:nucleotide exchange factor GrpE [Fimbriimonadales bacterium]